MKFNNVVLESILLQVPDEIWSSEAIERRIESLYRSFKVSIGRLELMTGIRERRVYDEDFVPSRAAASVASKLLQRSRVKKENVGLLIHSGVCRDRLEPATAAYVHQLLGLRPSVQFMDISNACLGFLNAIALAGSMIETGAIRSALIVTAENSRSLIDNTIRKVLSENIGRKQLKQYFANLTIGSGAVAAMLCHREDAPDAPKIVGGTVMADSTHNHLCEGGSAHNGHEMLTDSEALLKAGISLARQTWKSFTKQLGWADQRIHHYICHQVGKMHQNALYEGLGIDPVKDYSTYPLLGNMGSAALPGTLAKAFEENVIQRSSRIALLGIGSGISSVMMGVET